MNTFDLTLLSLYRIDGQEWPLLPGLLAQNPPKRAARGRDQDRLVVFLALSGNINYSNGEYSQVVGQLADTFYSTPGSLTYALKTAAEWLNAFLVDKNMKSTGKGLYSIGGLVLCALRGNSMYVVQSGSTHVYYMGSEIRHLYDAKLAGKGLGLSQTARLYFAQTTINAGDRVLLCSELPPNWDKSITEGRGSTALDITRRRLLAITDANVSALLMQASVGNGALNILQTTKDGAAAPVGPTSGVNEPTAPSQPANTPPGPGVALISAITSDDPVPVQTPESDEAENQPAPAAEVSLAEALAIDNQPVSPASPLQEDSQLEAAPAVLPTISPSPLTPLVTPPVSAPEQTVHEQRGNASQPRVVLPLETRARIQQGLRVAAGTLARLIAAARAQTQSFKNWFAQAFPRVLPGGAEDQHSTLFSRAWPAFFAVALPILLIVAARVVYDQLGDSAQYNIYYTHAFQAAQQISAGTDPTTSRVQWKATLDWLDKADQFQRTPSPESLQLREIAQTSLDKLDAVLRLNFQLAFDTTSPAITMQVTRMSASDTDIYLLDSTNGTVKRGTFNAEQKYTLDVGFLCGPGLYDGIKVDKLIDIIALPRSNPTEATLMAIDRGGNLLYCTPDKMPTASYLQVPDRSWNNITAFAYDTNNLYVLDAPARAVWVYFGDSKIKFPEKPYFFFESQVPVMLEKAIDMAINGDDLYLLHEDGHMTTCTLSRIEASPTRCNDPALYVDTRPGFTGGMHLNDGIFSQITFTSPPDPSVALLEPYTQSVFRFSARALELQNQVRSSAGKDNILPKGMPVTAMAISPNKFLFLFVDGKLYFAKNVP